MIDEGFGRANHKRVPVINNEVIVREAVETTQFSCTSINSFTNHASYLSKSLHLIPFSFVSLLQILPLWHFGLTPVSHFL